MSYSIDYNPELKKRYPAYIRNKHFSLRPLLLAVAAIVAVYGILSTGALRWFIPGDPAVTTAAFSGMVQQIDDGEQVRDAFLAFCREVIANGS